MPREPYDYSPLTEKVTLEQLLHVDTLSIGLRIGISIAIVACILPIVAIIMSSAEMRQTGLYMFGMFLICVIVIIVTMLMHKARRLKIQRFAQRNHMTVTRGIDLVHRRGAPFLGQMPTTDSIALTTPDSSAYYTR